MISGIGIDMVDVRRIERQLSTEAGLTEQLFTAEEIAFCRSRGRAGGHFAARFAAKEAFLKALGTGFRAGIALNDIEVTSPLGQPRLVLSGKARGQLQARGIARTHLSMAHAGSIASAVVILEI